MGKYRVYVDEHEQERKQKAKVIAVMNNKGGCGKTTTATALGMYLVRTGHDVLFWDNDPQSNLTQRLGIPDDVDDINRLETLFRYPEKKPEISTIMEYPYLQRIPGTENKPGTVALIPGSHYSESYADDMSEKFKKFGRAFQDDTNYRSVQHYFDNVLDGYKKFYDYIVIDTAPALEGNILNRLSVRSADDIIYPVDGIEAALGIRQILNWMDRQNRDKEVKPNGLFAMVKYQRDTKNVSFNKDNRSRNTVFRIMKDVFGNFVCENGVKELRSLRHGSKGIPGFGGKTQYTVLCEEIVNRINRPNRDNLFDFTQRNGALDKLEGQLAVVARHVRKRRPKHKKPKYREITAEENGDE